MAFADTDLEELQAEAKERERAGKKIDPRQPVAQGSEKGKTLEKVGEKAGCSHETARQYKKIADAGQLARRNLTDFVRGELVLSLEEILREEAEENSSSNNRYMQTTEKETINDWQNFASRTSQEAQKDWDNSRVNAKLGKEAGISREQVRKIKKLKDYSADISSKNTAKKDLKLFTLNDFYGKIWVPKKEGYHMTNLKEDKFVHFDLNTPVEENFNKYQDILAECPHKMQAFKLQFDQYLKSKKLHMLQANDSDDDSIIEFKVSE